MLSLAGAQCRPTRAAAASPCCVAATGPLCGVSLFLRNLRISAATQGSRRTITRYLSPLHIPICSSLNVLIVLKIPGVLSTPVIFDADGDGQMEIGFGALDHHVYLLNRDKSLRWVPLASLPVDLFVVTWWQCYMAEDTVWASPSFARHPETGHGLMVIGLDITANPFWPTRGGIAFDSSLAEFSHLLQVASCKDSILALQLRLTLRTVASRTPLKASVPVIPVVNEDPWCGRPGPT